MVGRFGSREICDVTFKALTNDFVIGTKTFSAGQPVFVIDTATASSMEQSTTTVYARGGKGYNRLISWEGEKEMTFTVTDALMSAIGFKVLTDAGFAKEDDTKHVHVSYDIVTDAQGNGKITAAELAEELGIAFKTGDEIKVCNDTGAKPYGMILDGMGAVVDWADKVTFSNSNTAKNQGGLIVVDGSNDLEIEVKQGVTAVANKTVKIDFYVVMTTGATEITIEPGNFGGFFYVEADTLYRNEAGKDMAATITFPKVKIQSAFSMSMTPTGDPSTFDFTMDAFPAYTYFDRTKKVVCDIVIVSGDTTTAAEAKHTTNTKHTA